jgi:predicted dehydrogenase
MDRRQFITRTAAMTIATAGLNRAQRPVIAGTRPNSKVRVGFVGTAHPHAPGKLAAIRDLAEIFELVGVVEPNEALRKTASSKPEFLDVDWLDEDQLYAVDGLQAVVVETEFPELIPAASRAVAHGKHVHVDKPPGKTVEDLAQLLATAKRKGVHVQQGYMLRYNPAFEICFQAAREAWLGRVFELNATMSTVRPFERRKDLNEPRAGVMFDLGSHLIDSIVTVLGPPQKVTPFARNLHRDLDDVSDNQLAVLEYPDAIATVRATFVEPFAGERRQFVVCGENGTLEIRPLEPPKLRLSLQKPAGEFKGGVHDIELPPMRGRYHAQLEDFASVTLGRSKPRWTDEHDLAAQAALLQACGLTS